MINGAAEEGTASPGISAHGACPEGARPKSTGCATGSTNPYATSGLELVIMCQYGLINYNKCPTLTNARH